MLQVCHGKCQHAIESKTGKYPILATSGEIGRTDSYLYDKPSVLIGRKGTIDKPQYVDTPFWTIDTLFYTKVTEGFSAKFMFYLCQTIDWSSLNEASGVPSLSANRIETLEVYLPNNIDEQLRIAESLDAVETHTNTLQSLISKYEAIKKATVNLLMKPKEGWRQVKLGEAFTFGNGYTPSKAVKGYWENGTLPWFRMEDIRANGRILKDSIQHITSEAVKDTGLFPAGSFILSTTATLGEYALLIADSLANQQFTFLVKNVNRDYSINTMWFLQYLAIIGEWCRKTANAGGLLAVNMNDLYNYEIPLPPLDEQKRIVAILDSIDGTINGLKSQLAKSQDIKRGMMTYFFG